MKKSLFALSVLSSTFLILGAAATSTFAEQVTEPACVDSEEIIEQLGVPESVPVKAIEVMKLDKLTGVCAYVLETPSGRQVVIGGERYLFNGKLLDLEKKEIIQDALLKKYQVVGPDDFKVLKEAADLVLGSTDKDSREVVLLTDPECPYCKKLTEELNNIENLRVYMVFTPLSNHPRGVIISKMIACGDEEINDIDSYFAYVDSHLNSSGQATDCDEYEARQKSVRKVLRKHGVSGGVPKLFFSDGRYEIGAMPKNVIESFIGAPTTTQNSSSVVELNDADKKVQVNDQTEVEDSEDESELEAEDEEVDDDEAAESSEEDTSQQSQDFTSVRELTPAEKYVLEYPDVDRPTIREAEIILEQQAEAAKSGQPTTQNQDFKKN